ncbi:MAG TPA: DUF4255 domain-containing protein [Flavobacteriaceae bacterium]|nr:hypothetical protein [Flavobacteriaceae bacterium]HBR53839.1 DUF4255 domain-containing protein [Flavobacteriaceae bacterium]HIB47316.1 DUF4255 domain-containing protein [Flavobacteriaceae bacterium]HIN99165.1 DUF4255 domain-containing protein [Flavobacteriaceae bacterium]
MIHKALEFLQDYLNKELKMTLALSEDSVVASSLVNPDGSVVESTQNKVVISIVNMEHETFVKSTQQYKSDGEHSYGKINPPIHLNLYLLITSNHSNYLEAYKRLSVVITKFQANPYFNKNEFSQMPDPIKKLTLEIFNIPITELSHIWSGIGAKYVPSIIYKMRMVTLEETKIKKEIPGVTGLGNTAKSS